MLGVTLRWTIATHPVRSRKIPILGWHVDFTRLPTVYLPPNMTYLLSVAIFPRMRFNGTNPRNHLVHQGDPLVGHYCGAHAQTSTDKRQAKYGTRRHRRKTPIRACQPMKYKSNSETTTNSGRQANSRNINFTASCSKRCTSFDLRSTTRPVVNSSNEFLLRSNVCKHKLLVSTCCFPICISNWTRRLKDRAVFIKIQIYRVV